jgi:hypothetical protein
MAARHGTDRRRSAAALQPLPASSVYGHSYGMHTGSGAMRLLSRSTDTLATKMVHLSARLSSEPATPATLLKTDRAHSSGAAVGVYGHKRNGEVFR